MYVFDRISLKVNLNHGKSVLRFYKSLIKISLKTVSNFKEKRLFVLRRCRF
jgi:hypothetical protein